MSKLIDKLNNSGKGPVISLGFKKVEDTQKTLQIQAIVDLSGRTESEKREICSSGITAVVLDCCASNQATITKFLKNENAMIKGLIIDNKKAPGEFIDEKVNMDFIIFDIKLPAAALTISKLESVGKILKVGFSDEIGMLRAVAAPQFSIESVIVDLRDSELLLEDMLHCRKVADLTGRPMIASINRSLSSAEISCLRDTGFKGILMGAYIGISDIKVMLDIIKNMPEPVKKKEKGSVALLPRMVNPAASKESDGGDDDGDDDDDD